MDITTKALETLRNASPAGDKAKELQELILKPNMTGKFHAATIDIPATQFRGWNNQSYNLRGCLEPRAVLLQIGSTPSVIVMDNAVATVFIHGQTLASYGVYKDDTVWLKITRSDVNGLPIVIQDMPQNEGAHFPFRRSGLVKLSEQKADPLADRKELKELGKVRKQVADITSAFSAWESEVASRAQKIENLQREFDRNDETITSTDSKCKRLDSKIAGLEARVRKGRQSADRMAALMGEIHRLTLSHDGYGTAFDAATERNAEITKEIKQLEKPVKMPEKLKTLLG